MSESPSRAGVGPVEPDTRQATGVPGGRLDSWKEIAVYLNRGQRTVQRWEQEEGLPVRRLRHEKRGSVFAYKCELDAWWASRHVDLEETDAPALAVARTVQRVRKTVWAAAVGGTVALLGLGVWFFLAAGRTAPASLRVVPLTSYAGFEGWPSFSPDGKQVAFAWDGAICVKAIGADASLRLTEDAESDFQPVWAPDGRSIAFLRTQGGTVNEVRLVPAAGGAQHKVGEIYNVLTDLPTPFLAWSPDGRWLVLPDKLSPAEPYALTLLSAESGEKRRLTAPPAQSLGDSAPAFSPDGRRLAFVRCPTIEVCDLHVVELLPDFSARGEPTRLTSERAGIDSPMWIAGGGEILYVRRQGHISTLWRIHASGSRVPKAVGSVGGVGTHLTISAQRDRLAYTSASEDRNIYRLEIPGQGGEVRAPQRLTSSTRIDQSAYFSPDGRRIAFMSYRTGSPEIWVSYADGSDARQLTSSGGPMTSTPRWSPDAKEIAFDSRAAGNAEIYVIGADGGKPRRVTAHPANNCVPSWSGDGKWLYFASDRTGEFQVWKTPVDGGEAVQVTRKGGYGAFESSDGRSVYYGKSYGYGETTVWRVPAGGGEETKVLDAVWSRHNFFVVDDGIYFTHASVEDGGYPVCFYRFATGAVEEVTRLYQPPAIGLSAWPSDRPRWLLFSVMERPTGDLMLVENFR